MTILGILALGLPFALWGFGYEPGAVFLGYGEVLLGVCLLTQAVLDRRVNRWWAAVPGAYVLAHLVLIVVGFGWGGLLALALAIGTLVGIVFLVLIGLGLVAVFTATAIDILRGSK
jgi:pimeloyl-ACP methyl ester carboxylesterase